MKAVIISKTGGPEVLELKDIQLEDPKSGEVLIKNEAIGLNYIDTYHRSGLYPVELPSNIGIEGAGIIEKVGPDVNDFKVGDRVAYASMPIGSYSTHRIFPTKKLVKVPEGIELENVVTLMTKGITTFYLLHKTYPVKSGETILYHAAAGGVGQIFCQWARAIGCTLIGTVGSDEKVEIAKKNGCDHVINYSTQDFAKEVMEITNGKGVDAVYDGVGLSTFEKSLEAIKLRGMFLSFGNASGMVANLDVKKHLAPKAIFFTRPSVMPYTATRPELELSADRVFTAMKEGKIKIDISHKYSLDEAQKSHEDLHARKLLGPAILIP